jgi:predicted secreted hydrolase
MDKEFGSNQLSVNQVGWDWFSLQLDDGREVMLYLLRDSEGEVDFARGSMISKVGIVHYLEAGDWVVNPVSSWRSGATATEYPAGWTVEISEGELELVVVPELADQENRSRIVDDLFYWEGLVRVDDSQGKRIGHGYVELTGYGTAIRPAI